jgi:hypothetical protein
MKEFRIQKLDRRHNGFGLFTHYIEPIRPANVQKWGGKEKCFIEIREWFW